jgi:hypothetical protein
VTWSPGETVVVQEVWRERVWAARPMKVVRDDGDFVALWFPKGTCWKAPIPPSSRPREPTRGEWLTTTIVLGDWVFEDAEWGVSTLTLLREGDWHAVWIGWLDNGEQWGWYVNLQRPFRRTRLGFETMDLMLDVIIELDRTWRWKDEDELELFVERGVFDEALAERVRGEGLEVARRAERNEGLFAQDWAKWRPVASTPLPELPPGWDVPCP